MKYISLIHALNIPCELDTGGDWHIGSINWENLNLLESDGSIWGDYGIEQNKLIPMHEEYFNVANHIRALLDLLFIGNFSIAEGMNDNYIGNSKYDLEIFNQVIKMINLPNWNKIDKFMDKEYLSKWINYKKGISEYVK